MNISNYLHPPIVWFIKSIYKRKDIHHEKVVHRSDTRGRSVYDWLDSHHSFSFDEYYNPERVHFGALRVLNDDRVAPGEGFQTHPHKNMEIVSIPLKGLLAHGDSKRTVVPLL